ncbi:MAG: 30S ribosomal protein S4 [Bdellovibrionales bacterium RIFCSPHIGHO2_01_FULL_40_29]|nr:MAG: 30S ribosomal protein S4 [Bdellovibrionales bacterium RIFCSPHIGHO2_01_FULL_40_29]OFZ33532.1 MAG: 30S ribosomal protein S4 [Bdellovibrionales bacterium RIFCSPHIGHO2_02_FULL_40_15]
MNPKNKIPRFKLQRRLMVELPGLGKAGALDRKPYPPGQHGQRRIKYSEHRLQLEEKQKIRIHYGLREEQLIRLVKKAKKSDSRWCHALINSLEKRLDNIIFRGGFAQSIASANQLISHGKILINGKKVTIRSYTVKQRDLVSLKASALQNQAYLFAKHSPRLPLPDWLTKTESDTEATLRINAEPAFDAVPFALDESLVTSYYSKT